ncbi:MAG: divergent polysaccharide deacetylase family protein [Rhizomicrobium sp.]
MSETMAGDDFDGGARAMPRSLAIAWIGFLALVLIVLGGVTIFGNPHAGDPVAIVDLGAIAYPSASAKQPVRKSAAAKPIAGMANAASPAPPSSTAMTLAPPPAMPAQIAKPIYAGRALVADPALIEQTSEGPLPRIADDGRTPMAAYAPPIAAGKGPRIAIVITGLGISAKMTAAAIAGLPAGVTLAFAPYSDDVQRWVNEARQQGHEVLLEVPMEPYDFPDSDPGPHTLRAAASEDTNIGRLKWSLTRITGYAGVTNLLGGRFLGDSNSLEPVMTFLQRRGLLFFDSGPVQRSAAPNVAKNLGAPYVQASSAIDAIQTGMEIDERLSDLETRARANGAAAGSGFLYPVTIERVANWAKGLQGRGFVLVPASAIIGGSK